MILGPESAEDAAAVHRLNYLTEFYQQTSANGEFKYRTASIQPRQQLPQHVEGLAHVVGIGSIRTQLQIASQILCRSQHLLQVEAHQSAFPQQVRASRRNRQQHVEHGEGLGKITLGEINLPQIIQHANEDLAMRNRL